MFMNFIINYVSKLISFFMFIATDFIFISGPVVVLPSDTIRFQAIYPPNISCVNGEWWITKNNITAKLDLTAPGFSINTDSRQPITQNFEIRRAAGNGGAYHLSVGTTKSNIINVFVDGIFFIVQLINYFYICVSVSNF